MSSGAGQQYGFEKFIEYNRQLGEYSERLISSAIAAIPDSRLQVCEDLFEDHGLGDLGVKLKLTIKIRADSLTGDFTGSGGSERHQRHPLVSQRGVKDLLEELHRSDRIRCHELALGGYSRWSVGREIPTRDSE